MRVQIILVDKTVQFLETKTFALSPVETMRSDILEAKIFTDEGKLLAVRRRKHWNHYIKYEYKPEPIEQEQQSVVDPVEPATAETKPTEE
jgi:hypothetical protein